MLSKSDSIIFPSYKGSGPRILEKEINFQNDITNVVAILSGFSAGYSKHDEDEHLGNIEIRVVADVIKTSGTIKVTATFGLRDWSGDWDDAYEAIVYFTVLAG